MTMVIEHNSASLVMCVKQVHGLGECLMKLHVSGYVVLSCDFNVKAFQLAMVETG